MAEGRGSATLYRIDLRMYRDNDYNYYVYVSGWGYAIAYFANRIPIYNAISATKVDIDIRTLEQVGI